MNKPLLFGKSAQATVFAEELVKGKKIPASQAAA